MEKYFPASGNAAAYRIQRQELLYAGRRRSDPVRKCGQHAEPLCQCGGRCAPECMEGRLGTASQHHDLETCGGAQAEKKADRFKASQGQGIVHGQAAGPPMKQART